MGSKNIFDATKWTAIDDSKPEPVVAPKNSNAELRKIRFLAACWFVENEAELDKILPVPAITEKDDETKPDAVAPIADAAAPIADAAEEKSAKKYWWLVAIIIVLLLAVVGVGGFIANI